MLNETKTNHHDYDKEYFAPYFRKGSFGNALNGEKSWLFNNWLKRYLKHVLNDEGEILEVGCGPGFLTKYLETEDTFKIVGLDISAYAAKLAKGNTNNSSFLTASAECLPFKPAVFDCVIALDVLEHLKHPEHLINNAFTVLKKGGVFLFRTPNLGSYGSRKKGAASFMWRDSTHIGVRLISEWRAILAKEEFSIKREGTDALWDVPYWSGLPAIFQQISLIPLTMGLNFCFGFLPWQQGENYFCVLQK